jgi:hypothetical protein
MSAAEGNTTQALARWRHTVASSEALGVLYWVMHPTLYRRIHMMIKFASNSPAFSFVFDFVVSHNHSYRQCYGQYKMKPSHRIVCIGVI